MENPVEEIKAVVQQLTATNSPDIQKAALESYMTSDVAFRHPVCSVNAGPNSRNTMLGIYQYVRLNILMLYNSIVRMLLYRWYRVLSPQIEIKVESISQWRSEVSIRRH